MLPRSPHTASLLLGILLVEWQWRGIFSNPCYYHLSALPLPACTVIWWSTAILSISTIPTSRLIVIRSWRSRSALRWLWGFILAFFFFFLRVLCLVSCPVSCLVFYIRSPLPNVQLRLGTWKGLWPVCKATVAFIWPDTVCREALSYVS
jgi:hypothetical protein